MTLTDTPTAPSPRSSRRLTTSKAMVEAISYELEHDPSVFYMGEDVGAPTAASSAPPPDCWIASAPIA